jgi:hypothetical protein
MSVNLDIPILNRRLKIDFPDFSRSADDASRAADEVGKAIGRTADDASSRLSSVQMPSLDLGSAVESARRTIDHAVKSLSEGGDAVAQGAERAAAHAAYRAGHIGEDLDSAVKDLKSLRITRDRGRDPWPGVALIMGAVAGVVAMFLFDPRDGRRRRTVLRDKVGKWGRIASREARGRAVDLRNRSQGMVHEARSALGVGEGSDEQQYGGQTGEIGEAGATSGLYSDTGQGRQAVGVAAGGTGTTGPAAGDYSDWSSEPGRSNGRDTIG